MIKFPKEIKNIISTLEANRFEGYVAGECVRDSIGGLNPYAWDIATNAGIDDLKRMFESAEIISEKYCTVRLEYLEDVVEDDVVVDEKGIIVDIYRYRNLDGSFADTIEEDLKRRDFTCDCIADSGLRIVNPLNGMEDIKSKLLKTTRNPNEIFEKNPLKIFKALGIVAHMGMDLSRDVYEGICQNYRRLNDCEMKRIGEGLYDMMDGGYAGKAINMMVDTGILNIVLGDNAVKSLTARETSDLGLICKNIDKTHKVPERRLGVIFGSLSKGKAIPAIERLKFDKNLEQKLKDAVLDMPSLYFSYNAERLKNFMYEHGMERFEYMLNLEKAMRIVFELDTEMKIRSKLYTLDQIRASNDPVFLEDLCIDANDLMEAGIAKDKEQAQQLLGYVLEHCHYRVKDHTREKCLKLAKLYKRDPLSRAMRKMQWFN